MAAIDTFKTLLAASTPPPDAQISALLAQADVLILGYTYRPEVPAGLDDARAAIALVLYNRSGAEGEYKRVEGEVASVFEPIPELVKAMLRPWRVARALMAPTAEEA